MTEAHWQFEEVAPLHAARTSQRDVPTTLNTYTANQRIVGEEMARRGWGQAELEQRRKADAEKIKITRGLRAETTMTWGWITERLAMGTSGYTADCLRKAACSQDMRSVGLTRFRLDSLY